MFGQRSVGWLLMPRAIYAQWMFQDPCHPGRLIADPCERKSLSVWDAAARLDIECADLTAVLEGQAPATPELALRTEAAGWSKAANRMRSQSAVLTAT